LNLPVFHILLKFIPANLHTLQVWSRCTSISYFEITHWAPISCHFATP